ncbi:hypothetical protein [Pseudomonas sp. BP8]|uniref:hypothetical protein n=1 Tax=Pseudomonas sp. BP8 TaxID=2817864 RepID=UPI001AE24A91|nr:hypothetical protein [Pseudomonas sp. BP8]MBP2263461.1 hypothetical protein [Pseudomonas sp. BP8]HDS1736959.1 hypothetical protein [Pseudomonas putida]
MLPRNVYSMLRTLLDQTEAGQLKWDYDDERDLVSVETSNARISICYSFNPMEDVGEFKLHYYDKLAGKQHSFVTNQLYNDYEQVRIVYDSAQASKMQFRL